MFDPFLKLKFYRKSTSRSSQLLESNTRISSLPMYRIKDLTWNQFLGQSIFMLVLKKFFLFLF